MVLAAVGCSRMSAYRLVPMARSGTGQAVEEVKADHETVSRCLMASVEELAGLMSRSWAYAAVLARITV